MSNSISFQLCGNFERKLAIFKPLDYLIQFPLYLTIAENCNDVSLYYTYA